MTNDPSGLATEDILRTARAVVDANARAVGSVASALGSEFARAAHLISTCRGKLVLSGSGTSGVIALRAAHLFSVAGAPAFFLAPADGLHGGLGAVAKGDVVLALSKGGGSEELNRFCEKAQARADALIVVTATPRSALADLADVVLVMELPEGGDLGEVIATASSLAAATITDALTEVVRVARGTDWARVLDTHPSGAVGRDASATLARLSGESRGR